MTNNDDEEGFLDWLARQFDLKLENTEQRVCFALSLLPLLCFLYIIIVVIAGLKNH